MEETELVTLELLPFGLVAFDLWEAGNAVALKTAVEVDRVMSGIDDFRAYGQSSSGNRVCRRDATTVTSSASAGTIDRGSDGPVFISSNVACLRHVETVLGLMSSSRLSSASEGCDHFIAALTACVVVALQ